MKSTSYLFLCILSLVLYQCANIGQPDGGVRDLEPPVMDTLKSTLGLQRNFHPDQDKTPILLAFNEWIKIEDAFKQVIVSPPLQYAPKIEMKGKGVQVKLDPREVLMPQTTYTINFGKAIKDITEGNIVKDLRYVFSTGDIIDTGSINGKVFNALTGETKEELLVMLYTSNEDTIVFKKKPIYFSRTDKNGVFNIQNIKDTSYKIAVLEDVNSNYLYDQDKELFGFLTRRVTSGEDSNSIHIPYFQTYIKPKISFFSTDVPGVVKLVSNIPLTDLKVKVLNDSTGTINADSISGQIQNFQMIFKDTLMVYYLPLTAKEWNLEISDRNKVFDTITITKVKKIAIDSFKLMQTYKGTQSLAQLDYKELEFNHPVGLIDTNKITVIDDTTGIQYPITIIPGSGSNLLKIQCPCNEGRTYTYVLLPGAILDYAGDALRDTVKLKFRGLNQEETGILILEISDLDSTKDYSIILIQDEKPVKTIATQGVSKITQEYRYLLPGSYTIQILEDQNKNGHWDPGEYLNGIQPEKLQIQKNYSVRANWELREQLKWKL